MPYLVSNCWGVRSVANGAWAADGTRPKSTRVWFRVNSHMWYTNPSCEHQITRSNVRARGNRRLECVSAAYTYTRQRNEGMQPIRLPNTQPHPSHQHPATQPPSHTHHETITGPSHPCCAHIEPPTSTPPLHPIIRLAN
eukprot:2511107-Rhodomonas_salina.1